MGRIFLGFILSLFSFSTQVSWAKPVKLVYGGLINLDTTKWEVVDTKAVVENVPQSFVHRKESDLKGWLIGGTPDSQAKCSQKSKGEFSICPQSLEKDSLVYHQIILTRQVDKKAFQNYLISFTYQKNLKTKYDSLVAEFISQLDKAKQ